MAWLYALGLKLIFAPIIVFIYWLLAVKGGPWLCKALPDGKLKRALTKERTF
jgi:hypothetical protein